MLPALSFSAPSGAERATATASGASRGWAPPAATASARRLEAEVFAHEAPGKVRAKTPHTKLVVLSPTEALARAEAGQPKALTFATHSFGVRRASAKDRLPIEPLLETREGGLPGLRRLARRNAQRRPPPAWCRRTLLVRSVGA
jgi:hypothetical protein